MAVFEVVPVFHVVNLAASLRHYTEVLGFEIRFQYGDSYAGVQRDKAQVHLSATVPSRHPPGNGSAYFFCDDVDAYFEEVKGKGATIIAELQNYDYGMRDFGMTDPDGNSLSFGQEIKEETTQSTLPIN